MTTSLAVRNLLFTLVVPSVGAVALPWWILTHGGAAPVATQWYAAGVTVAGGALYLACMWAFAVIGRGTPGPGDPPRHLVAVGPCRWVRKPDLRLGAPGRARRSLAVRLASAADLRRRYGDRLPPVLWLGTRSRRCAGHLGRPTSSTRSGSDVGSPGLCSTPEPAIAPAEVAAQFGHLVSTR